MLETIEKWWKDHKDEMGKCAIVMLGAVVWYVGRELMHRHRLPFVSPDQSAAPREG